MAKEIRMGHGVVGVVVKAADSHVANCTIQVPDPGVEKHAGHMCMHAHILREE